MRGHTTELLIRFEKHRHWGNLVRIALFPVHFVTVLCRALARDRQRLVTLTAEIRGVFSGLIYYWRHRLDPPDSGPTVAG
jgi:hypothetical protein